MSSAEAVSAASGLPGRRSENDGDEERAHDEGAHRRRAGPGDVDVEPEGGQAGRGRRQARHAQQGKEDLHAEGDGGDVQAADGEQMHRAAVHEERLLFLAHLLLLAQHHGAVDCGQGGLIRDAGAQDAFEPAAPLAWQKRW